MLGEQSRDLRGDPAPAGVRQHPIADLDDPALSVEVVQDAAADDVAGRRVERGHRQHPPAGHERWKVSDRLLGLLAVEVRHIGRFAKLGIGDGDKQAVDVVLGRERSITSPSVMPTAGSDNRSVGSRIPGGRLIAAMRS
jgi:hypothetical protein